MRRVLSGLVKRSIKPAALASLVTWSSSLYFLSFGILMGLSIAAPPGPVNSIIASESLRTKLHGTSVGAGAMTADSIFFVLTYFLRFAIPNSVTPFFYIMGSVITGFMTYVILRSKGLNSSRKGNYLVGLVTGLTNPFQLSWWVTAGLFMIERLTLISALGFFMGITAWILSFPYFVSTFARGYAKYVKYFSATVMIIFALLMFYIGVSQVLR